MGIDYKQAGVDVKAGEKLVDWLRSDSSPTPHSDKIVSGIGGFAALFRADFKKYNKPCLVSCTDGVGTKIKLASYFKSYKEVAQDLVAMCVNDMVCIGAEPLFFLDYFSTSKLDNEQAQEFLHSVRKACYDSNCALIGGETAEMPGVYQEGDFDCAGFSVGVVDEEKALGAHRVQPGDKIVAVASSGFHSNGFSLIRKLFEDDLEKNKQWLLEPTRLYVKPVLALLESFCDQVSAVSHITGGGLDNICRVLPDGVNAEISPWKVPSCFMEIKSRGSMSWKSLLKTLNCGVGLALVVRPEVEGEVIAHFKNFKMEAFSFGSVIEACGAPEWKLDFEKMENLNSHG